MDHRWVDWTYPRINSAPVSYAVNIADAKSQAVMSENQLVKSADDTYIIILGTKADNWQYEFSV